MSAGQSYGRLAWARLAGRADTLRAISEELDAIEQRHGLRARTMVAQAFADYVMDCLGEIASQEDRESFLEMLSALPRDVRQATSTGLAERRGAGATDGQDPGAEGAVVE